MIRIDENTFYSNTPVLGCVRVGTSRMWKTSPCKFLEISKFEKACCGEVSIGLCYLDNTVDYTSAEKCNACLSNTNIVNIDESASDGT